MDVGNSLRWMEATNSHSGTQTYTHTPVRMTASPLSVPGTSLPASSRLSGVLFFSLQPSKRREDSKGIASTSCSASPAASRENWACVYCVCARVGVCEMTTLCEGSRDGKQSTTHTAHPPVSGAVCARSVGTAREQGCGGHHARAAQDVWTCVYMQATRALSVLLDLSKKRISWQDLPLEHTMLPFALTHMPKC